MTVDKIEKKLGINRMSGDPTGPTWNDIRDKRLFGPKKTFNVFPLILTGPWSVDWHDFVKCVINRNENQF